MDLIKVPIRDLEFKTDVSSEVHRILKNDPENAYTVKGLATIIYNGNDTSDLKNYHNVRRALLKLVDKGLVTTGKKGQKILYYLIALKK